MVKEVKKLDYSFSYIKYTLNVRKINAYYTTLQYTMYLEDACALPISYHTHLYSEGQNYLLLLWETDPFLLHITSTSNHIKKLSYAK